MNPYLDLFLTFAQIGVCTFGGGYAMLPILQREVVEKRGWATEDELMDYYAIGQCTPGVIAVNTSTFIGYRLRGVPGAITATAGMVFPSLVIITIIANRRGLTDAAAVGIVEKIIGFLFLILLIPHILRHRRFYHLSKPAAKTPLRPYGKPAPHSYHGEA